MQPFRQNTIEANFIHWLERFTADHNQAATAVWKWFEQQLIL